MTNEDFEKILAERLERIRATLGNKAKEYALNGDRLHNFKTAARIKGETTALALWGMAMKHIVSVDDLIRGRLPATDAMVDEKLGDAINYLILLEAVFKERV